MPEQAAAAGGVGSASLPGERLLADAVEALAILER